MLIVCNWKMNPENLKKAYSILNSLKKIKTENEIWIAPPSLYFYPIRQKFKTYFKFGLQNIFYEKKGAYTGEISASMAKNLGASFVILGHSERKKLGEDLRIINKKVKAGLGNGLVPVLCFGEKERQKNFKSERNIAIWEGQLKTLLKNIAINKKKLRKNLYLVYEPEWAISTQKQGAAYKEYLNFFLAWYKKNYKLKILYGGSVDSRVIKNYLGLGFDGFLIGSASLKQKEISKIIKILQNSKVKITT